MIELVDDTFIFKLNRITGDDQVAQKKGISVIREIVELMPHPRAYVCEPSISKDDPRALLWIVSYDILTAVLRHEDDIRVVEPETLRVLSANCPALLNFTTVQNPFIMTMTMMRLVDFVYFPDCAMEPKRRKVLELQAKSHNIENRYYRPRLVMCRVPRCSPPTT